MIDPRRPDFSAAPSTASPRGMSYPQASAPPVIAVFSHADAVASLPHQSLAAWISRDSLEQASEPFILSLAANTVLEPTALEQLTWYLFTHEDADAVSAFHIRIGRAPLLCSDPQDVGPAILVRRQSLPHLPFDALAKPAAVARALADRGARRGVIPEFLAWHDGPPASASIVCPTPRADSSAMEAVPQTPSWHAVPASPVRNRRALLIVPWFTMGGADKFNLRLTQQLSSKGWEVTLAATNRGDQSWLPDFAALTPDVFVLPHFVRPNAAPLFLRHLIQTRRPQVVMVSNSELGYLALPYLRHHCPDPAYVDYSHMEEPRWKNGGWSRYGAAWQDHLELNIVTSNYLRKWMISRGAEPDRVEVCTINEDPSLWQAPLGARESLRKRLEIPQSSSVILYAARICEQKQPHVFAHTLQLLASRGVDFHAIIAGDGPDRHALEADLRARGVSNRAHFLLAVPAADMPAVYAASDLLFLPSDREGIALVMFEAMAAGLPVVGAAVGGQPELVTPECGVLIPKSNPTAEAAAYADVIAALLSNPAKRDAMGRAGRQRIAEHFSLEVMGDRMVALFERALTLAKQQPRPGVSARTAQELATLAVEYLRVDQSAPPPALAVPLRYRLADSLNLALKRFGLSGPLKRAVLKVARNKQ